MDTMQAFVETLKVSRKQSHRNLSVIPLLASDHGDPDYLTLEEGISQGFVIITEISTGVNPHPPPGPFHLHNELRQGGSQIQSNKIRGGHRFRERVGTGRLKTFLQNIIVQMQGAGYFVKGVIGAKTYRAFP
jgi:hypothetical protein